MFLSPYKGYSDLLCRAGVSTLNPESRAALFPLPAFFQASKRWPTPRRYLLFGLCEPVSPGTHSGPCPPTCPEGLCKLPGKMTRARTPRLHSPSLLTGTCRGCPVLPYTARWTYVTRRFQTTVDCFRQQTNVVVNPHRQAKTHYSSLLGERERKRVGRAQGL